MRQKRTRRSRSNLAAMILTIAFAIVALFAVQAFNGGTPEAGAQTPTPDGPACELAPDEHAELEDCVVPSASYTSPDECTGSHKSTHPYAVNPFDNEVCFNIAVVATAYCVSSAHEVVISIVNPLDGAFDSDISHSSLTAFFEDDFTNYPPVAFDPDDVESDVAQMFWADLTINEPERSNGDPIIVTLYGAFAGSIEVIQAADDCPKVTAECTGATPGITFDPNVPTNPDLDLVVRVLHRENGQLAAAPLTDSVVLIPFDDSGDDDLTPPGSYTWGVGAGESTYASGEVYCIELDPQLSCSAGQVRLTAQAPDGNSDNALGQLEEIVDLAVTVNGQSADTDLPDFSFVFPIPPGSIGDPVVAFEPLDGAPANLFIDFYYSPDADLTIPVCQVDFDYVCSAGQRQIVADTTGTPGDTVVRKTDPSPVAPQGSDGGDPAGTLLTFTIGENNDDGEASPGAPSDNGVRFSNNGERTIQRNKLDCMVDFDVYCSNGVPTAEIGEFDGGSAGTPPGFAGFQLTGQSGLVPPGVYAVDGALNEVTASDPSAAVYLVPPDGGAASSSLDVPGCVVEISIACVDGQAVLTADAGDTGAEGINVGGSPEFFDGGTLSAVLPEPYPGDLDPTVSVNLYVDGNPDGLSINDPAGPELGFEWAVDGETIYESAAFDLPRCVVDVDVECGSSDEIPTGIAEFRTDLTGTPMTPVYLADTEVFSDNATPANFADDVSLTDGTDLEAPPSTLQPGDMFGVRATNGVWVTTGSTPNPMAQLDLPYCTVTLDATTLCVGGRPAARIAGSNGVDLEVTNVQGGPVSFSMAFDQTFVSQDASQPIVVEIEEFIEDQLALLVATVDGAPATVDDLDISIPPRDCLVDVDIECAAGAAFVVADTSQNPGGTTTTPGNGEMVAQGTAITISADNGVFAQNAPTEQRGASIVLISPICEVGPTLACQSGAGGPTGLAVLQTDIPALAPDGTAITPPAGTTVPSEGSLTVSTNNPDVYIVGAGASSTTLTAPACIVAASGVARCASPGIEIEVTTSGAAAAAVVVNGTAYPASSPTTTVSGLPRLASYQISAVPADPGTVAAAAAESVTIAPADRCMIEITVGVTCIGNRVLITVAPTPDSTGSVDSIAVNGDTNLPFLVAPSSSVSIAVTSSDTRPADITIPTVAVPSRCSDFVVPSGTLFVDYDAVCDADGQNIIVDLRTTGSAGILALSVNGDAAAPYLVAPGELIVVSVLTLRVNDVVIVTGPAQAPVCIGPSRPQPTPSATPSTTPAPSPTPTLTPAIVVNIPDGPTPGPTPQATPEPTTQATPEPTPEPTPEATPEPTPEATPEPTPEATTEPTPSTRPAERAAIRQHGQSVIELPASCDVDEISLPGAVTLVRDGVTEDGRIRFVADTATLDVGSYSDIITCGGEQIEVELFVYRQIGGARGEANSVSRLAITGGLLTIVLIGVPGFIARRDPEG